MHLFLAIAFIAIAGLWPLSWLVGRFRAGVGFQISLVVRVVANVAVLLVSIDLVIHSVRRGGWFIGLAAAFVLLAAGAAAMAAFAGAAFWLRLSRRG